MSFSWKKVLPLALLATTMIGCASRSYYSRRYPPPPPPRAYGVVGMAPGPGYMWIDGYYDWRAPRYHWVPGRWVRPPRARTVWVPGHWDRRGRDSRWVRGHWR
jgi:hypothetical protein